MIPFASNEDAQRKLNSALITYEGEIYQCAAGRPDERGRYTKMVTLIPLVKDGGNKPIQADYTSNGFQAIPYELGFLNDDVNECAMWIGRHPERISNVGIDLRNVIATRIGAGANAYPGLNRDYLTGRYAETFRSMIFNKYPAFDDALQFVIKSKKPTASRAFNKMYALAKSLDDEDEYQVHLYHMDRKVAKYSDGKFVTSSKPRRFMLNMIAKSGVIPHDSL